MVLFMVFVYAFVYGLFRPPELQGSPVGTQELIRCIIASTVLPESEPTDVYFFRLVPVIQTATASVLP